MMPRLRRTLFGLDARAVNSAFKKQIQSQQEELELLQNTLENERSEEAELQERIERGQERLRQQEALVLQLQQSRRQAQTAAPLIQEGIKHQVRELDIAAERERESLVQRLNGVGEETRTTRRALQKWLQRVEELAQQVAGDEDLPTEQAADAPAVEEPAAQPPAPPLQSAAANAAGPSGRILSFRAEAEQKATAEKRRSGPLTLRKAVLGEPTTGGWRPGRLGDAAGQPPAAAADEAPAATAAADGGAVAGETAAKTAGEQVSSGLQQRIGARMMRLLQGKVVGQDLHGNSGLLAAKGTPITAQLAEQAQAEGVLPDLILHMTWPDEAGGE